MANERALGVSFIYAAQTWRQLATVAEPARDYGRILIGNRFAQSVCDSMPGWIRWNRRKKRTGSAPPPAGPDCRLTTSPSPSAFHIIDHLVAGAP
jgi:hypothetical protein